MRGLGKSASAIALVVALPAMGVGGRAQGQEGPAAPRTGGGGRIGPGQELAVPGKEPQFLLAVAGDTAYAEPPMFVSPGKRVMVQAQPLNAVAKGEEWLEKLLTGSIRATVAAGAAPIPWGPAVDGLQCGIGLDGETNRLHIGETAGLNVYVRNVGTAEATVTWLSNGDPLQTCVKGPGGDMLGIAYVMTTSWPTTRSLTLGPGETRVIETVRFRIARTFQPPSGTLGVLVVAHGAYSLRVPRISNYVSGATSGRDGDLPSGELPIVVAGP